MKSNMRKLTAMTMTGMMAIMTVSCKTEKPEVNLADNAGDEQKIVEIFTPMERSNPDAKNVARTAFDKTVIMAEEELEIRIEYNTYTSENYQEKSFDDVALDRIRNDMDDLYLLNPDVIKKTAEEGKLTDLSGLDCAKNIRDVVRMANTVNGKLVGIPQEVVVYGLFVNKDMFDQ